MEGRESLITDGAATERTTEDLMKDEGRTEEIMKRKTRIMTTVGVGRIAPTEEVLPPWIAIASAKLLTWAAKLHPGHMAGNFIRTLVIVAEKEFGMNTARITTVRSATAEAAGHETNMALNSTKTLAIVEASGHETNTDLNSTAR